VQDFPLVQIIEKQITNSIGMKLRLIPPGEFLMGSTEKQIKGRQAQGGQQGWTSLPHAVYLGAHEVTRGQFRQFVEATGYKTDAEKDGKGAYAIGEGGKWAYDSRYFWDADLPFASGEEHPVVNVTWADAAAFCNWLSEQEGVTYMLPSEALWEFACRAGSPGKYCFGNDDSMLHEYAWLKSNSGQEAHFVGQQQANGFGLHDMHGNVWEWCGVWRAPGHDDSSRSDDRARLSGDSSPAYRGGDWGNGPDLCRSTAHKSRHPTHRSIGIGFRIAANVQAKTNQQSEAETESP
jgi:formylglycine-generating enzyme required for sulfatase activity